MTGYGRLLAGAWGLAGSAALVSLRAWSTAVPPVPPQHRELPAAPALPPRIDSAALAAASRMIKSRDPFRLERKPANVAYSSWEPVQPSAAAPPPKPSRPTLVLAGILGGPPWQALVEGIPGREGGVLLAVGAESNGVRLQAIRGDTAFLAGFDTSWALLPRRTWR